MERVKITSDKVVSERPYRDFVIRKHVIECTFRGHVYTGRYTSCHRGDESAIGEYEIETKDGRKTYGYATRLGRAVRKCL